MQRVEDSGAYGATRCSGRIPGGRWPDADGTALGACPMKTPPTSAGPWPGGALRTAAPAWSAWCMLQAECVGSRGRSVQEVVGVVQGAAAGSGGRAESFSVSIERSMESKT